MHRGAHGVRGGDVCSTLMRRLLYLWRRNKIRDCDDPARVGILRSLIGLDFQCCNVYHELN